MMPAFVRVRTATRDVTFMNPTEIVSVGNILRIVTATDLDLFWYPYSLEYEDFDVTLADNTP